MYVYYMDCVDKIMRVCVREGDSHEMTYKIWLKQHVFQWGTHVRRGTAAVCIYVAVMAVMLCAAVTKASRWPGPEELWR